MITSISNEKIRHVAALQKKARLREEESLLVAEGSRLFLEAPEYLIKEVYVTEDFLKNTEDKTREKLAETGYEEVSEQVFAKMADTRSPQGILAVLSQQSYGLKELLAGRPLLLLLENIQDPGNLGTIFRTAEGAGATGVILSSGCADPYQPKVVRSAMGSLFRVPFYRSGDLCREIEFLKSEKIKVYAAYLECSECYDAVSYLEGCAFLIGNEGNGLMSDTAMAADERIRIPMEGKLESLNAGVSAALLLYEAARQRRGQRYQGK